MAEDLLRDAGATSSWTTRSRVERARAPRGRRGATCELEVAPEDRGRVIGRGGRTADALRTAARRGGGAPGARLRRGDPRLMPRLRRPGGHRPRGEAPGPARGRCSSEPLSDRPEPLPLAARGLRAAAPGGAAREVTVDVLLAAQGPLRAEARRASTRSTTRSAFRGQELRIPEEELDGPARGLVLPPPAQGLQRRDHAGARSGHGGRHPGDGRGRAGARGPRRGAARHLDAPGRGVRAGGWTWRRGRLIVLAAPARRRRP